MGKVFSQRPLTDFAASNGERVVVTGASGMLGREVVFELLRQGYSVTALQRSDAGLAALLPEEIRERFRQVRGNITDIATVEEALSDADGVIHLAAKVSFAGAWEDFLETNVRGTRVLVEKAKDAGISRFLFISSPSVAHTGVSFMGEGNGPATPEQARGHYAKSKAMAELLALESDSDDFWVGVIRPHIVWGPGDTQLVERVLDRAAKGTLPLLNKGTALIDTTYIDNAVDAIVAGYRRLEHIHGTPLVVTNGQPRQVAELLAGMCEAAGITPPSRSVPAFLARGAGSLIEKAWEIRPGEDEPPMTRFLAEQLSTSHWFDQSLTRRLLDWEPAVSIEEGYEKLGRYYRK
ncbi:NAD-dependent epimerase/dehydratase family protein [Rothia aerolata]|uniref:Nucleoside-diphosphate sugar epimerase n=1 Tax=Rothia aerolata TaxID=1812262 RepID=A0A917MQX9_9MICC|nr:SDR family NAD(P)-dependent oxidoreductase [Rothia aerolata]GGH58771.1 nucleoside-diphosphate sugar epimerase [Rothia aerolata]